MGYDEVIPLLGEFGRYQKRIYLLLCLPAILCAFHKMGNVFLQSKPNYRCLLPHEYDNATYELPQEILNASFPYNDMDGSYSNCSYYAGVDVPALEKSQLYLVNNNTTKDVVTCDKFVFDHTKYKSSTVIEWNLVCGRAFMTAVGDSIFMLGVMIGSIVFGDLSDRYGRKPIFFTSLVIQVVFGVLAAIAPEFWSYTITRCVIGATTSGVFLVAYVIAMEMVGPQYRLFAGVVCQMFFSTGYMLTAAFAYAFPDWRHLQVAITLPGLVFFSYWWFVPESARWLLTKGKPAEAVKLVQAAAKENGVKIDDERLLELLASDVKIKQTDEKKATILDIFRHTKMRNRSLIIFFDWLVNSMTYYGLSWNTKNLGGNDYLNFVISGAVEIPAYLFLLATLNRWGRRNILCGCMVAAGIALLLTMAVPKNLGWLTITLAMLGKLAITASYGTIYIFSVEQFPTVIRNAGLGAGSTSARVGSVMAPLINLTSETWKPLPLIIFGILALMGGVLSLVLPETLNKQLPETIADGERFGQDEKKKKNMPPEIIALNGVTKDEQKPLNEKA